MFATGETRPRSGIAFGCPSPRPTPSPSEELTTALAVAGAAVTREGSGFPGRAESPRVDAPGTCARLEQDAFRNTRAKGPAGPVLLAGLNGSFPANLAGNNYSVDKKVMPRQFAGALNFFSGICLLVGFLNFRLNTAPAVHRVTVFAGPLPDLCGILAPRRSPASAGRTAS